MKAFGAALKQAREEAGITLDEIHVRTKINLKHLRAIESGDFPSVPQTYVRAFIREYARNVGLDEMETLSQYNQLAEELKGIPKPPEALDNSHLTPKIDDSVEIVPASQILAKPRHVEVSGKPEVEEDDFVVPVKKSKYVSDDHKSVQLPSSPPQGKLTEQKEPSQLPRKEPTQEQTQGSIPFIPPEGTQPEPIDTEQIPKPERVVVLDTGTEGISESGPAHEKTPRKAPLPETELRNEIEHQKQIRKEFEASAPVPQKEKKKSKLPDPEKKPKADKPPKKRSPEDEEQRRIMIIGSLISLAVIIGIFGIWYFSTEPEKMTSAADSTAVNPNLYADRFIDSNDFIPDEPEALPDTTTGAAANPAAEQQKENVYAREDSLVLEAFSSTPVYFSIRMDTTKTEKGFLSSNEHKVWKAKDHFIISLGDAGAMTFFLNGKQLKPLGGDGLAINNHVISRRSIDQD